jgi:hypothetical protein
MTRPSVKKAMCGRRLAKLWKHAVLFANVMARVTTHSTKEFHIKDLPNVPSHNTNVILTPKPVF